jgi:hypothetical protein
VHRVSARELVQRKVNAGSPGSYLNRYLAVQGPVGSRLGAWLAVAERTVYGLVGSRL